MLTSRFFNRLLGLLLAIPLFGRAQVPASLPVNIDFSKKQALFLTDTEIRDAQEKIRTLSWAKASWKNIQQAADSYTSEPFFFPENEGGWTHQYVCPLSGASLKFDRNSPHKHFCADCNKYYEGLALDRAWNSFAMTEVANRLEVLAISSLLGNNKKHAQALKNLYLDVANKYEKYRVHDRSFKNFGEGAEPIAGRALSQSIDECNLLTKLSLSYDGLLASQVLSPQEQAIIEQKLWGNANKILHRILDLRPSGGNWWVWHSAGGLAVGLLTHDASLVEQALNDPKAGIMKMLASNYLNADGLAGENSPGYQLYAMMAVSRMALISKHIGLGFEKIPSVQKAFTAMAGFRYSDFTLPNMNDGRKYDLKSGSPLNPVNMSYIDLLEMGWGIYHSTEILGTLADIYAANKQDSIRASGVIPLIYGPSAIPVIKRSVRSNVSRKSGIAMMRSTSRDWNLLLKNTNPDAGHAHPNNLQIALFANGEEFVPSFGTPEYGHPSYQKWYVHTVAHNTLNINQRDQARRKSVYKIDWAVERGPVAAVRGSVVNVQDDKDPGQPVKLTRTAFISPLAFYDFFRVAVDSASAKKFTQPVNTLDWVMHFNGKMHWNGTLQPSQEPLAPGNANAENDPYPAWHLLTEVNKLQPAGQLINGVLDQPGGGKVAFSFFPLPDGGRDYQAQGPGYEHSVNDLLPLLIRRSNTNQALFGGVYVPFKEKNPLKSLDILLEKPNGTAVSLSTLNGNETVFQFEKEESVTVKNLQGSEYRFTGSLGLISLVNGESKRYFLLGKSLSDAMGTVSTDAAVPIVLTLTTNGPKTENFGDTPVTVTWKPKNGPAKVMLISPAN